MTDWLLSGLAVVAFAAVAALGRWSGSALARRKAVRSAVIDLDAADEQLSEEDFEMVTQAVMQLYEEARDPDRSVTVTFRRGKSGIFAVARGAGQTEDEPAAPGLRRPPARFYGGSTLDIPEETSGRAEGRQSGSESSRGEPES